ncbi:MAG: BamA/TamA family outer membrane protein [Vicingaceae bacterium]
MSAILVTQSCSVTRNVPEQERLLNNVRINVNEPSLSSDLYSLVKQKENKQLLWVFRFKLRFYSLFLFKKDSESKLRTKVGEPPVIYDSSSTMNTVNIMYSYLRNKGYYESNIKYEEHQLKWNRKKLRLTYRIETGEPTVIGSIKLDIKNPYLADQLLQTRKSSLLKKGANFDIDVLDKERTRITRLLKNQSYFFFSEDLVYYAADTGLEKRKVMLTIKLKEDPQRLFGDSTKVDPYTTYKINDIYLSQDLDRPLLQSATDTLNESGYLFINGNGFSVRPKVVRRSIFLSPRDSYSLRNHESTLRRLSSLNNYQYINISYKESANRDSAYFLDCHINVSPSKPQSISVEPNLTNTGGNLGINAALSYQHRNIFRGAEALRMRFYFGLEAQSVRSQQDQALNTTFNTREFGPELSITFPKFLLPFDQDNFAKRYLPKTTTTVSYNYQERPDYTRIILNTNLNYWFKESETKSHSIQPINLSQIKIDKDTSFARRLEDIGNSALTASYEDNFITSIMYTFVYNNQVVKPGASYQIVRANAEFAGNLLDVMSVNVFNAPQNADGQYLFNGIPYAQFFRTYLEFIQNFKLNQGSNLVGRSFVGLGLPYGNSFSMPFVRSFYSGGTNGIRAWRARRIGPGTIPDSITQEANVDQIGDIKIEFNLEYRFKIFSVLEGALFADIGNIWVLNNPEYDEAAQFAFDKILPDIAVGAGMGGRLNFDFFIIRLDAGWRIKDPGSENPRAFKINYSEPVINFAIGYPF